MIKLKNLIKEKRFYLYREKKNPFSTESPAHDPWVAKNTKKPDLKDYIRDGKIFGKIVKFDSWKGMKLAYINPTSGMHQDYKGGSLVGYDYNKLKISQLTDGAIERNVGRPIWVPK